MAKKKLSYNEAVNEVEKIIAQLENEELDVDELSSKIKYASELLKTCKDKLRKTESEVEKIIDNIDSDLTEGKEIE